MALTINASALGGVNFDTYIASYFAQVAVANGSSAFHDGGTYVSPYGYFDGDQVSFKYRDFGASGSAPYTHVSVMQGEDLAYDMIAYGPSYGSGISGHVDSVTFGTIGAGDTVPAGGSAPYTAFTTEVVISGFDITQAPGLGGGSTSTDPVPQLYYNLRNGYDATNLAEINALIDRYAQNYIGSAGNDSFTGAAFDDSFKGAGGTDVFNGGDGTDTVVLAGAASSWTIAVGGGSVSRGADTVALTGVEFARFDDATYNFRTGVWTATNFAPENLALDNRKIDENAPARTLIGTLSAADPESDAFTWTLAANSANAFEIADGKLYAKVGFDFESAKTQSVTVIATDVYGNATTKTFTVDVNDVNEAPTALQVSSRSVREDAAVGSTVATLLGLDPEKDDLSFSIVSDPSGDFAIKGQKLVLTGALDFESASEHVLRIKVTDSDGLSHVERVTIGVLDTLEAVDGTATDDTVLGTAGRDALHGFGGADRLVGAAGSDRLVGGLGDDTLIGGKDADSFIFNTRIGGGATPGGSGTGHGSAAASLGDVDQIVDFKVGQDAIGLSRAVFDSIGRTLTAGELAFGKAGDKNDFLIYDRKTGDLMYDADGSGKHDAVLFATLDSGLKLHAHDFFMI